MIGNQSVGTALMYLLETGMLLSMLPDLMHVARTATRLAVGIRGSCCILETLGH